MAVPGRAERLGRFIALGIATWFYRNELGAVLASTLGATLVSAGVLVALLRQWVTPK